MSEVDRLFSKREAAGVAVRIMWPGMVVRLLALAASVAVLIGILTFFFFDSLVPYRWWLIIGGTIATGVLGLIGDRITPTREDIAEIDMDRIVRDSMDEMAAEDRNNN